MYVCIIFGGGVGILLSLSPKYERTLMCTNFCLRKSDSTLGLSYISAKANAKTKLLPDGLIENPIYCSHLAETNLLSLSVNEP